MYEINVFSNLMVGKKSQAKSIFKDIDAVMAGLGFTRTVKTAIPNLENATIYRMVGRYKACLLYTSLKLVQMPRVKSLLLLRR